MPATSTAVDFGTPKRNRKAGSGPNSPGTPFSHGRSPKTPGTGGVLRAAAPPFFMSGTDLNAVVPLAGYCPGPSPYSSYSPYHKIEPSITTPVLPDFPTAPKKVEGADVAVPKSPGKEDEIPEVSEEDWQRRLLKRAHEIEVVKALSAYQNYMKKVPNREDRSPDDPQTPKHDDRKLAKRRWKAMLEDWRTDLRQKYDARIYQPTDLLKVRPPKEASPHPEALAKTLRL